MTKFIEIEAKSILQKYKFRDDWFWNRYGVNPYRGCQFACNYCDAITEKYLVHESYKDFSRIIYVKKNAPEILGKEVKELLPYLEPFAPSPERRLDAVDKLNKEGIQAGVDFTPIVPYLLDGPENIEEDEARTFGDFTQ